MKNKPKFNMQKPNDKAREAQAKRRELPPAQVMRLKDNHTWQAPAGYKIVVLDRGAVSFNIPEKWFIAKLEPAVEIHDGHPPDDNARISVSFWRMPPGIDWTELPLDKLLEDSTKDTRTDVVEYGALQRSPRTDLEIVWKFHRFIDPVEKREAITRMLVARGFDIHALITFDFWVDDAPQMFPVWAEILNSLLLGRVIDDPTKGEIHH